MEGGWGGVVLSNSAPDLQWFQGVMPGVNRTSGRTVALSLYDSSATMSEIKEELRRRMAPLMRGRGANQSIDLLRLDNVTNGCDLMEVLLAGGGLWAESEQALAAPEETPQPAAAAEAGGGGGGGGGQSASGSSWVNPKVVMLQVNFSVLSFLFGG